jgi:hypothetical protein
VGVNEKWVLGGAEDTPNFWGWPDTIWGHTEYSNGLSWHLVDITRHGMGLFSSCSSVSWGCAGDGLLPS